MINNKKILTYKISPYNVGLHLILLCELSMNQIQKISSYLLIIFNILIIAIPLIVIIQWIFIDTSTIKDLFAQGVLQKPIQTPEGSINLSTIHWTILSKSIGLIGHILGILPLFLSLFVLKSIFQNYKRGEIFSTVNAVYYRYLGWLFFLDALLAKPVSDSLMVLAATLSNKPGHRYLTLSFGTPNMEALFCGVLVIVISWVMLEASKLHYEQKFTI